MNQRLAFIIFAFAFIVAIVAGFYSPPGDEKPAPAEFRAKLRETIIRPSSPRPSGHPTGGRNPSSETKRAPASEVAKSEPLSREAFLRKYGERLGIEVSGDRVIRLDGIAIRATELSSDQKSKGFRPSHPGELVGRAREILNDARALLGVSENMEFGEPITTPGESTGQVIFPQSRGGTPIFPGGLVTILVGPEGDLRSLDSSIYPVTEIANSQLLPQPNASRSLLYVTEAEPKALLRYVYETMNQGIQTLTDAQTGAVLFTRDRRVH